MSKLNSKLVIYSEVFKRKVVSEIERGIFTKVGAAAHYGIAGNSTIYRWYKKYGDVSLTKSGKHESSRKQSRRDVAPSKEHKQAERINQLEMALVDAQLHIQTLRKAIEIAEEHFDIQIEKKFGSKQ